jgi:MFS superfamily sulfate permease-like transporter
MLAAIAIPGQLATARLAGMPPETGLYAFVAGSLAFGAFGANRFMTVAADSTIAPIFAGGVATLAAAGTQHYAEQNWARRSVSGQVQLRDASARINRNASGCGFE